MKRRRCCWALAVFAGLAAAQTAVGDERQTRELFPVREPFDEGVVKVSDIHTIAYSLHGNPKGKPIFVLHGGPGAGCYPRLTQYFNPEKFLIVLHDQRGSGRSQPVGEIRENTTQDLVEDIERLRKHLKIDGKILVFGGSWGSALALAYAETHPDVVSGMVIRGVWTCTKAEVDNSFRARGVRKFFPDAWARLERALGPEMTEVDPKAMLRIFTEGDDRTVQKVADAWIRFYIKSSCLHASDEEVEQAWGDYDARPAAKIDCHYTINGCFFEEGQLLRDAPRLKGIPMTIINGRYDMMCPPITAYRLHKLLPKSKLIIVEEAGHSEAEPGTTQALLEAVAEFE